MKRNNYCHGVPESQLREEETLPIAATKGSKSILIRTRAGLIKRIPEKLVLELTLLMLLYAPQTLTDFSQPEPSETDMAELPATFAPPPAKPPKLKTADELRAELKKITAPLRCGQHGGNSFCRTHHGSRW